MRKGKLNTNRGSNIPFSIAICTHNRANLLVKAAYSIIIQKYPCSLYELLIIDNNSTDNTKGVSRQLQKKYPNISIHYFFEKRQGISYASNKALRVAKNNIVIFLDDDEIAPENFLSIYNKIWKRYINSRVAAIGGKIDSWFENEESEKLFKEKKDVIEGWVLGLHDLGKKERRLGFENSLLAGNFSLKKKVILRIGGFDTNIGVKKGPIYLHGDDVELCFRILKNNYDVIYSPQTVVKNLVPVSRFQTSYLIDRYLKAGLEMQYVDRKTFGRKAAMGNSKNYIIKNLHNLYRFIRRKPTNLNIYQFLYELAYSIQTALTILR